MNEQYALHLEHQTGHPRGKRAAVVALRMGSLALCALALVACKSRHTITGSVPDDYRLRHPITLQQSARTIDIPVGMHSENLTPSNEAAVIEFARQFHQERAAVIQVMVPSGSRNESSAVYMSKQIRLVLLRQGVPANKIDLLPYGADPGVDAPLRLAYPRVEAKTLPCGSRDADLASDSENRSHFDFGCSTQQNMAAMVANPQDLIQPRGWEARDSVRRDKITENYRNGSPTWSEDLGSDVGSSSEVK
jgi:pilus assembly protein CpaD